MLVGQLSTSIVPSELSLIKAYREQNFCDMPHVMAFPRGASLTLGKRGKKLKHAPISLKIVSNCLSCHTDSKNALFDASPMLRF